MKDFNENHFDEIDYDNELPKHMTEYYVERKCGKMLNHLRRISPPFISIGGIDLGCGIGHHINWFNRSVRFKVAGIDTSTSLISKAEGRMRGVTPHFWVEDIRDTGYKAQCFDFAYTINVLHHLPSLYDQIIAMKEAARILKKGGLYFILEMNFRNPLIRLYVKHIFRHFRNIDQGNEMWFDRQLFEQVPELKLIKTEYFTFTPDFCPKWLLPLFRKIDKWADGKWIARFGAHVMYVLEKL